MAEIISLWLGVVISALIFLVAGGCVVLKLTEK